MSALEHRVQALIDDRLFKAYWDAVSHFQTKDLVLIFNEEEEVDPVFAYMRERIRSSTELPDLVKAKLQKPASDVAVELKSSEASFWLIVLFSDEEAACVAINGKAIAPGGHA
ncbi:MAG: hypothetical protein AAB403_01000 [Planctomycetota bacterium]